MSKLVWNSCNVDMNNDGVSDIKSFSELTITLFNFKMNIGKFLLSVFKFMMVTFILYIVTITFRKLAR